jgi:hypothetical protein
MGPEAYHNGAIRKVNVMFRFPAWLLVLLLFAAPLSAIAGDAAPASGKAPQTSAAGDIQGYISAITGDMDQNPHSCYEADDDKPDRPDLADRPQS